MPSADRRLTIDSSAGADLTDRVRSVLAKDGAIQSVELTGSRARGEANQLSDWDFKIETRDFLAVASGLHALVYPLRPIAQQWDRLSEHACYMLMLRSVGKVDLIFEEPWETSPPWKVSVETLQGIDDHFWDWAIWLAAKDQAGKQEFVHMELGKMHAHLLAPLDVESAPGSLRGAIKVYSAARARAENRLGVLVRREVEDEVRGLLSAGSYAI